MQFPLFASDKSARTLSLKKQTLRQLTDSDLRLAAGGGSTSVISQSGTVGSVSLSSVSTRPTSSITPSTSISPSTSQPISG